ncbi:mannose-6-phosphate isomerase, class I [Kineococcus sp. SYSU DK003]|uniref:mannose-6-phosphate isomerase, class I n=1 Tax=Kineococcus sp. SYSU DK003 TaxID=3383124 RepID=UPI003D7E0F25
MIVLAPGIRNYDWGTRGGISHLLGRPVTDAVEAELWIGAHPGFPTPVVGGGTLADVVAADPRGVLGEEVAEQFGERLPFLLKVLAAGRPLSVQVHPTPEQARAGFADEDARGIPRTARERNYVDEQAKPEMMVAVGNMRALAGFREPAAARSDLLALLGEPGNGLPAWDRLHEVLSGDDRAGALCGALSQLLSGGPEVDDLVGHLVAAAGTAPGEDVTASVVRLLAEHHPGDPGIAVGTLLNHVDLAPGEAVFLDAGTPHAYLQGVGVEVMSTSDNVLRGGLTSKHVDLPELLRIVEPVASAPHRVVPAQRAEGNQVFQVPVGEFQLQRLESADPQSFEVERRGPVVLLVVRGTATVSSDEETVEAARGDSFLLTAGTGSVHLLAGPDGVLAFAATVGR